MKAASAHIDRFYADDVTANGFVSGAVVRSKGDVDATGTVVGSTVESRGALKGESADVEGNIKAGTLTIGGAASIGSLEAKKVVAGGVDLAKKVSEMEEIIEMLLKRLETLEGNAQGLAQESGQGSVPKAE